jgi:hypothetical protein
MSDRQGFIGSFCDQIFWVAKFRHAYRGDLARQPNRLGCCGIDVKVANEDRVALVARLSGDLAPNPCSAANDGSSFALKVHFSLLGRPTAKRSGMANVRLVTLRT